VVSFVARTKIPNKQFLPRHNRAYRRSREVSYWLERSDLTSIIPTGVINCHTPDLAIQEPIWNLGHSFVRPVPSAEIHVCGPVVREIFAETAGGAVG